MKMTRLLFVVWVGVTLASMADAQPRTELGFAVGMNYNMHTGADLPATATGVGLIIGGQADISFNRTVGLLTTVSYDNRIGKYSESGTFSGYDYTKDVDVTVAYLSVEPLLKYIIPDRPWCLVTGPSIGFPVQGKSQTVLTTPGYAIDGYESSTVNVTIENLKPRFEWKFGAGYFIQTDKKTVVTLRLTYARGFTDVQKGMDWRVNSITFLGSIDFTLGR
jgi:hypothetical protein